MEAKTDIPPPSEGDPEPSDSRTIVSLYALLGDRAPAIMWVDEWKSWVRKGDIPSTQFDSLQTYLDEFPYHVEVSEDFVVVTDPGFGNGAIEWAFKGFKREDGQWVVVLTETDTQDESSECKVWVGEWYDHAWLDLTDIALPLVMRSDFFGSQADARILEEYELVALQYVLSRNENGVTIHPKPNAAFECHDGKLEHEDLSEEDAGLICKAWESFWPEPIALTFDSMTGTFCKVQERSA